MPLYYAYGSNMDRAAMAARCPASRPIGVARLPHHRLVVMREGYVSVARHPRRNVWGLLWDLAFADIPGLDRYEEIAAGLYRKISQPVLTDKGPRRALVYLGRNVGPGTPFGAYMAAIVDAGREVGLPDAYIADVQALAGGHRAGSDARYAAAREPRVAAVRTTRRTPLDPDTRPGAPKSWVWTL